MLGERADALLVCPYCRSARIVPILPSDAEQLYYRCQQCTRRWSTANATSDRRVPDPDTSPSESHK